MKSVLLLSTSCVINTTKIKTNLKAPSRNTLTLTFFKIYYEIYNLRSWLLGIRVLEGA